MANQDEKLKRLIAKDLDKMLNKKYLGKVETAYVAYLCFSVLGSLVLECEGLERLETYYQDILDKRFET